MDELFRRKELIYTIYREQSFSKAAQKLFIAQPSLSLLVKKLEERLGVPLFDRSCKPIQLTEAGREYISAVEQIQQIESTFKNYISAVNSLDTGSLGIGSNQLLSSLVLPKYISSFMQTHPKIKLTLKDANSTTLQNEILAGRLDIIIDNQLLPEKTFEKQYLATEYLFLAVPTTFAPSWYLEPYEMTYEDILQGRHISDAPPPVSLDAFANVPFILMNRDNDTRMQTNAIFQETRFSPKVLLEMDRLVNLYSYIEIGTAASIVSDTLIRNIRGVDHSHIRFYSLPTRHAQRKIYVSYKRNKFYSQAMASFIESLHDLR